MERKFGIAFGCVPIVGRANVAKNRKTISGQLTRVLFEKSTPNFMCAFLIRRGRLGMLSGVIPLWAELVCC